MNDRFLKACRREPVDRTPVWFMRQAGRYMPEYREIRSRHSLLDICRSPELATIVTLQPVRRIDVDAAILFSDLLLPLEPMGIPFDFVRGEGPAIENPLRTEADIDRLKCFEPREALAHVLEAIRMIRRELDGPHGVPLIGFGGAPFTLASYAIEGGHSQNFALTKALMYSNPRAWHRLCDMLGSIMGEYMKAQIEAGAQVIQIFDSWAGALSSADYREFVLPHTRTIFDAIRGTGRADDSLRHRHGEHPAGSARGRRRRHRRRLAHSARRGMGSHRPRPRHPGQSRSDAAARAARPHAHGRRRRARAGRRDGPDTSSISATAFCRRRRSITCRRSRSTCTGTGLRMPDGSRSTDDSECRRRRRRRRRLRSRRPPTNCASGNARCVVLERDTRPGGIILTERVGEFIIDAGPDSLLVQKPAAVALCNELGLGDRLFPTKLPRTAFVLRDGELHPLPAASILGFPTRLKPLVKSTLFGTAGEVQDGRGGPHSARATGAATNRSPDSCGAGSGPKRSPTSRSRCSPASMPATSSGCRCARCFRDWSTPKRSAGSVIRAFRREHGPLNSDGVFRSFPNGLAELIDGLMKAVPKESVRFGSNVTAHRRSATASSSTSRARRRFARAPSSSRFRRLPPPICCDRSTPSCPTACGSIRYLSTATVVFAFPRDAVGHDLQGTGFVVPRAEGLSITAGAWISSKWPQRAPEGQALLRAFLGGARDPDVLSRTDAELSERRARRPDEDSRHPRHCRS